MITNIPFSPAQSFFFPHGDTTPAYPRKVKENKGAVGVHSWVDRVAFGHNKVNFFPEG